MNNNSINGILVVNKPPGITSHDVVDFVRRRFKIKKVGHAGTLDPLATGVLVVLLGKATKMSSQIMKDNKEYRVTLKLGVTTDSGDAAGKIIYTSDSFEVKRKNFEKIIKTKFLGAIEQIPPMVSALKYKGKRLYELARRQIEVVRQPRPIHIYDIEIEKFNPPLIDLRVVSSKGTYIRTLCTDIGKTLGCGGHAVNMCRLKSGPYLLEDSLTIDELRKMTRDDLKKVIKRTDGSYLWLRKDRQEV